MRLSRHSQWCSVSRNAYVSSVRGSIARNDEKLTALNDAMQNFTDRHEDTANDFESILEKFKMSLDHFHQNLYLYPSYSDKFQLTLENMVNAANNLYDSTSDVMALDKDIARHAAEETMEKIRSDLEKLEQMNSALALFHDVAVVLDEATKRITDISRKYQVWRPPRQICVDGFLTPTYTLLFET